MFKAERKKEFMMLKLRNHLRLMLMELVISIKNLEKIVGIQTDKPLKRAIFPNGGIRMVEDGLKAYGYELDEATKEIYTKYRVTHNEGVFSAYNSPIRKARNSGIVTGLPDAYGRGRIIGDYRRVPLYGVDFLIKDRQDYFENMDCDGMNEEIVRLREEITMQINALKALKKWQNLMVLTFLNLNQC